VEARIFAIMSTVSAMFVIVFTMLTPWASVTRTFDSGESDERSVEDYFHIEYLEGEYSRIYRYDSDSSMGEFMNRILLLEIAWLVAAVVFVRLLLGKSRVPTVISGMVLLAASLAVALYFPIGGYYASVDQYPPGDYVLSFALGMGWYLTALAAILQSIGVLQLMIRTDSCRWDRAIF